MTNPVVDLGFFALGAIVIGAGFISQLWAPEHAVAGLHQGVIGLIAVAGWLGHRVEPLTAAALSRLACVPLVALHPARGRLPATGEAWSAPLAAVVAAGSIPSLAYAGRMLDLARHAGPSCYLGRCPRGHRLVEIAALAMAVVLIGALAAVGIAGWRWSVCSAASAAALVGVTSLALHDVPGSTGRIGGACAIAWSASLLAAAPWRQRQA